MAKKDKKSKKNTEDAQAPVREQREQIVLDQAKKHLKVSDAALDIVEDGTYVDARPRGHELPLDLEGFTSVRDLSTKARLDFDGDKQDGKAILAARTAYLSELQERLWAEHRDQENGRRVLLVIQGMDTAGKGGIVRHVVGAVDPQGVRIKGFKAPTATEKNRHFLWRIRRALPEPGFIGVFDRSHYEDVLIHRVHGWADDKTLAKRYSDINRFEKQLVEERGYEVVKVMLHISKEEQWERLYERLEREDKHWKFNMGDLDEREHWDAYIDAYDAAIRETHKAWAPWHVVPADRKWYARLAVQQLLTDALERIAPAYPKADFDVKKAIERMKAEKA